MNIPSNFYAATRDEAFVEAYDATDDAIYHESLAATRVAIGSYTAAWRMVDAGLIATTKDGRIINQLKSKI